MLKNGKLELLRYEISDWSEACECLSNSSRKLHITYDSVLGKLTGGIVRVEHEDYGCLFAYLVQGSGSMLQPGPNGVLFELSNEEILMELEKYGFNIQLSTNVDVDDAQYQLVSSACALGMDKIRIMYVDNEKSPLGDKYERSAYIVAFKADKLSSWLSTSKACSRREFSKALIEGSAVNLSQVDGGLNQGHNWSWLFDKVLTAESVLKHAR